MEKRKKIVKSLIYIIIGVIFIVFICIGVKVINDYNLGGKLIDYPTEILKYNYNGEEHSSSIDKIEIEKSDESIFDKKTYYKIYLKDEYTERVVYVYIYRKYNIKELSWQTKQWEYYKEAEIENK